MVYVPIESMRREIRSQIPDGAPPVEIKCSTNQVTKTKYEFLCFVSPNYNLAEYVYMPDYHYPHS